MNEKLLELFKARDMDFIARFCNEGTYMDEHGREIVGVCRTMTAEEVLTFMHTYDAYVVDELNKKECDYCEGLGFRTVSVGQDNGMGTLEHEECSKCRGTGNLKI